MFNVRYWFAIRKKGAGMAKTHYHGGWFGEQETYIPLLLLCLGPRVLIWSEGYNMVQQVQWCLVRGFLNGWVERICGYGYIKFQDYSTIFLFACCACLLPSKFSWVDMSGAEKIQGLAGLKGWVWFIEVHWDDHLNLPFVDEPYNLSLLRISLETCMFGSYPSQKFLIVIYYMYSCLLTSLELKKPSRFSCVP